MAEARASATQYRGLEGKFTWHPPMAPPLPKHTNAAANVAKTASSKQSASPRSISVSLQPYLSNRKNGHVSWIPRMMQSYPANQLIDCKFSLWSIVLLCFRAAELTFYYLAIINTYLKSVNNEWLQCCPKKVQK